MISSTLFFGQITIKTEVTESPKSTYFLNYLTLWVFWEGLLYIAENIEYRISNKNSRMVKGLFWYSLLYILRF